MSSTLNKIHVTNSTGLSLNERFTAISSQPKVQPNIGSTHHNRSRSRSRSVQRQVPNIKSERVTSRANQRLLAQLQRKHKMQAALKLKRRSMRTVGGGGFNGNNRSNGRIQRGSVKAFRVGANGKPIRANSLARVATMKADNELLSQRNVPLRRTNSSSNLANRLGPRRPTAGGAAQRIAKRNLERQRGRNTGNGRLTARGGRSAGLNTRGGRSRSRSRTRVEPMNVPNRSRSRSRTRNINVQANNRSRSRNRNRNDIANTNTTVRRGRSRSRSRGRGGVVNKSALPIKARLGVRPGQNNRQRNPSLTRRGVKTGRVQKRLNSTNVNVNANATRATAGDNNRRGRPRSRSVARNNAANNNSNLRSRSRSRTRKGQVGQQRQQGVGQQKQQNNKQQPMNRNNRAPRGRNQQRRGNNNGKGQAQPRRGRSRSRTGRGSNGGSRNQGNKSTTAKPDVNKDALDKELDQYMATTRTENEMDYLLKN